MKIRLLALASVLLLLAASAASAGPRGAALGSAGEVYVARTGSYGDLFPDGAAAAAETPVLAVDLLRADQEPERILVPGTEDDQVESSPFVLFEDDSESLFVVWESRKNFIHSQLKLASYDGSDWSQVIEVSGDTFAFKSAPVLAVTRDSYQLPGSDGEPVTRRRTILHMVWWEEAGTGERAVYAPLILLDGAYIGWNPVYVLSDFDLSAAAAGSEIEPDLLQAPQIQSGIDEASVVVGFTNAATGRLLVLQVRTLAGELSRLADEARAHIIHIGVEGDIQTLADEARAHIIHIGARLHPAVLTYLADEARAHIIHIGAKVDIQTLADATRAHIIHIGAMLHYKAFEEAPETAAILEVPGAPGIDPAERVEPHHLFSVEVAGDLPAPSTEAGPTTVFLSQDGHEALVAWEMGDLLRYRESHAEGWSEIRTLLIGDGLDLDRAYRLLEERVRN